MREILTRLAALTGLIITGADWLPYIGISGLGGLLASLYLVLQTRFDYVAQHMFFLNRVQHVVMHHVGPFLIALGDAGGVIRRGMPDRLRCLADSRPVAATVRILQHPIVAVVLFLGLFYLWVIPAVHFRAMIDPRLYRLMNWSMTVDGLLFWPVILDRRPKPPARVFRLACVRRWPMPRRFRKSSSAPL